VAIELTEENFKDEVLNTKGVVMVDFWAPWCGPCKILAPIIEELKEEYKERAKIGKCNVDKNRNLAIEYGIMSIPTIKFFKGGKVIDELIGVCAKDVLKKRLDELISGA